MTPPIWSGTLARGARVAEEFRAEIHVNDQGDVSIVERVSPVVGVLVQPAEVRGDYWLRALVELAQRGAR